MSAKFTNFCAKNGIKRKLFTLQTPQQNDITERRNRSIMDCVRTLMIEKEVSQLFSREEISTIVYNLN
jgi:hypothetical protein